MGEKGLCSIADAALSFALEVKPIAPQLHNQPRLRSTASTESSRSTKNKQIPPLCSPPPRRRRERSVTKSCANASESRRGFFSVGEGGGGRSSCSEAQPLPPQTPTPTPRNLSLPRAPQPKTGRRPQGPPLLPSGPDVLHPLRERNRGLDRDRRQRGLEAVGHGSPLFRELAQVGRRGRGLGRRGRGGVHF